MAAEKHHEHDSARRDDAGAAAPVRFSALPRRPPAQCVPASPLLAQAWAASVLRFWDAGVAARDIDPAQPLYLFDPAPGDGQLAWLMLQSLRRELAGRASPLRPCYVACGDQAEALDRLATHPKLAAHAGAGWFDTALMPHHGAANGTLTLRRQRVSLLRTANPLVVLARHWFSGLSCELHAVAQGRALEGLVMLDPVSAALSYEWRDMTPSALATSPHAHLLADCAARTPGVALLIPSGACAALDDLGALAGGRYLLLSEDIGCHTAQQLRLGMAALPETWDPRASTQPVNYHALATHQQQQGARTWSHQLDDSGAVLHAACSFAKGAASLSREQFESILAPLSAAHPDHAAALVAMAAPARVADPACLLCLLTLSGHHPAVLAAGMPLVLDQAHLLGTAARLAWQEALHQCWDNHLAPAVDDGFHFNFGILAARLGDWSLAKACFGDELLTYGDAVGTWYHLAYCEAATGARQPALRLLDLALAHDPQDQCCRDLRRHVLEQQTRIARAPWYHADLASDGALTLEPIGSEHAAALFYQYRDSQIGILTRLPPLHTLDEVNAWIAQEAAVEGRHCCAVVHQSHGFIGVVSLQRGGDAGYFYFWIGSDFQDRGWGGQAARLLFAQAARNGVADLYTSVYQDNARSRGTLARLGFAEVALRAGAPDDDLVFLHVYSASTADQAAPARGADRTAGLRRLCALIDSPFQFQPEQEVDRARAHA